MAIWVKICGITSVAFGQAAIAAGADAIGLVLAGVAPPHRRLTADDAGRISRELPAGVARVGVFVDASPDELVRTARHVGLTHLQLHGSEAPELLAELPLPVIKAIRLRGEDELPALAAYRQAWGILLEAHVPGQPGGAGVALDWQLARQARDHLRRVGFAGRLILAGGLRPETVAAAIAAVAPDGVDVSSGVETDRQKDIAKIDAFVRNARRPSHDTPDGADAGASPHSTR